ncbi:helix-turn-helix transcriptional regulator [Butyrivibrio sp. MC2013]|uniref:helix-turn-helix transcriptional regulator n=1 Tax=Butyrivibrio sp. MC2013 TaxID=1280686 RepID=UPI000400D182|nr:helix-turn-helix domain-containing protein [Butyrivibrio sp. MC2013]
MINNEWVKADFLDSEEEFIHRDPSDEMYFYRNVAAGDIDAVSINLRQRKFMDVEGVGTLSRDPILNRKYHFVVTAGLISRICIENGMETELSFRLSDYYIGKLDDLFDEEEIEILHDEMAMDYARRMQLLRQSSTYSRPVSECMNYIYGHINDRITIEDLARATGCSDSYISRLFKREVGIAASEYIRKVKIDKAKNLLRFSDFSMVDIASYLAFSSQSHFIKLFYKETNMTPKKYRSKYFGTHWKGSM